MKLAISIEHYRPDVGGGENIALDVVRELRNRGHRVLVCAASGHDPIDFVRVPPAQTAQIAREWGAQLLLGWGVRSSPDVHYLHGAPHQVFLRYAIHATHPALRWWKRCEFLLKSKHRRAIAEESRFYSNPKVSYLAVSNFVAQHVAEVTAPLQPDIRILHNPVDTQRFSPKVRKELHASVRQRLGIPSDAIVFVWIAHNIRLKNLSLLLNIFPDLYRKNPKVRLLVVGKRGPRLKAPWLIYAGPMRRPEEAYAAADVMLHPSYYDTFGNVVTEALACGIPVVCSNQAGAAELLQDADCGQVLPVVGDSVKTLWKDALLALTNNPELRQRQGAKGRQLALTMDFNRYMDQLEYELRRFIHKRQT